MTRYFEIEGDYEDACSEALINGGQLYIGGDKQGPFTVVRGSIVNTFWPKGSPKREKLRQCCNDLGLDSYGMTGGRLARLIIRDHLQLPYKKTYYGDNFKKLAKNGTHWHCTKIVTGDHGFCYEFDIRSAYFSHYLQKDSGLMTETGEYLHDGGYMASLRAIFPLLPKWFRLQFLGVISSHQRVYLQREVVNGVTTLCTKTANHIEFGAAFNCVHHAILETYRTMRRVLDIAGDWCVRAHTDSFTLKEDTPDFVQEAIWEYLQARGLEVSLKGIGRAVFYDLNTGFIGLRFVGDKKCVVDEMRKHGDVIRMEQTKEEIMGLIDKIIDGSVSIDIHKPNVPIQWDQLRLF